MGDGFNNGLNTDVTSLLDYAAFLRNASEETDSLNNEIRSDMYKGLSNSWNDEAGQAFHEQFDNFIAKSKKISIALYNAGVKINNTGAHYANTINDAVIGMGKGMLG